MRPLRFTIFSLLTVALMIVGCQPETEDPDDTVSPDPDEQMEALDRADREGAAYIDLPYAVMPFDDLLIGGQPEEEHLGEAAEAGYRTVVNLRPDDELPDWYSWDLIEEQLGMRYFHIPVAGADDITQENAQELASILDEGDNFPILMHCSSGNRVGALFAARAYFLADEDVEQALEVGRASGLTELEAPLREQWSRE